MDLDEAESVLGVNRNASESRIKNTFRQKARHYHPDQSDEPDAVETFQQLERAKRRLLNGGSKHSRTRSRQPDTDSSTSRQSDATNSTTSSSSTSASTASETETDATSTNSTRSRTHPRGNPGTRASGPGPNREQDESQRVSANVWTGLSLSELFVLLRHYILPYAKPSRYKQATPVLVGVVAGVTWLLLTGYITTGLPQLALTVGLTLLAVHHMTNRTLTLDIGYDTYEYSNPKLSHKRAYAPLLCCVAVGYVFHRVFGADFGGIMPALTVGIAWLLFTAISALVLFIVISFVFEPKSPGSILVFSALLSLIFGTTTWIGPAFAPVDGIYIIGTRTFIAGVDVAMLLNVALSATLIYCTLGFYIYSSYYLAHFLEHDLCYGSAMNPAVWLALPGLTLALLFWLGENPRYGVLVDPYIDVAVAFAAVIAMPAVVFMSYMVRREIEHFRHDPDAISLRGLFRWFP
jgi:hypothetical protein